MTEHTYVDPERTYVEPILTGVDVLRPVRGSASNGGLSSRADYCALYSAGTLAFEIRPDQVMTAVTIERGNLPGTVVAVPVYQPRGECGPMASGAYVASHDSRFSAEVERVLTSWYGRWQHAAPLRFYGAVPLHDRWESWELYRALTAGD